MMTTLLIVYWVAAGLATEMLTNDVPVMPKVLGFAVSMVIGGIWIPARAIARVLQ